MDLKTGRQIFNSLWLIESKNALGYFQMLESNRVTGERFKAFADDENKTEPLNPQIKFFADSNIVTAPIDAWSTEAKDFKGFKGASVAVIPLEGPLMKSDFCGWYGTQSMMSFFRLAEQTQSVKTIVLKIDSPGGTVDGTQAFADTVKNASKNVITIVDGMMCSAAYWIGSGANEIIATNNTDMIGCIGTMISWYDASQYYEQMGIVLREYYATKSQDKNKAFNEANKGNGKLLVQQLLDPMNSEFLDSVKANRDGKLNLKNENVLTGKTYLGKDALQFGLADKIMPFDIAMNYALATAKTL